MHPALVALLTLIGQITISLECLRKAILDCVDKDTAKAIETQFDELLDRRYTNPPEAVYPEDIGIDADWAIRCFDQDDLGALMNSLEGRPSFSDSYWATPGTVAWSDVPANTIILQSTPLPDRLRSGYPSPSPLPVGQRIPTTCSRKTGKSLRTVFHTSFTSTSM